MALSDRVVSIFGRAKRFMLPAGIPAPPLLDKSVGGYALFMDEDEAVILYAKALTPANDPTGVPYDEATNSTMWKIDGQYYGPSRRDEFGNWIFRRVTR